MVNSVEREVMVFRKDAAGTWPQGTSEEATDTAGKIHLASIDLDLSLPEIYAGTELA